MVSSGAEHAGIGMMHTGIDVIPIGIALIPIDFALIPVWNGVIQVDIVLIPVDFRVMQVADGPLLAADFIPQESTALIYQSWYLCIYTRPVNKRRLFVKPRLIVYHFFK